MKQTYLLLAILNEVFPYVGLPSNFKGSHSVTLNKDKEGIDVSVWHLGCCWPVTATMDEFEVIEGDVTRLKNDQELRTLALSMKVEIEIVAAKRLAQIASDNS